VQRGEIRPWPPKNPTYWQLRYWTTELVKGMPPKSKTISQEGLSMPSFAEKDFTLIGSGGVF